MIIDSDNKLKLAIKAIEKSDFITYDIESTGLNVRKDKLIGFGFATSESESYYLPLLIYNKEIDSLVDLENRQKADTILNALLKKNIACWNSAFDIDITMSNFNIDLLPALHTDVLLLKHTVDEERPFGLKDVAKRRYGLSAAKEQEEMKESIRLNGGTPKQYFKCDMPIMAKYCEQDCKLTYRLYNDLIKVLESEGLQSFFYIDEVMPLYREVTIPMQRGGIPVDVDAMTKAKSEILQDIQRLEDRIQISIEPDLGIFKSWFLNKDFPPSRKGTFAQGVATTFGLKVPRTATGKHSLTIKTLANAADQGCKYSAFLLGGPKLDDEEVTAVQEQLWAEQNDGYMFNLSSKFHLKKLFFDTLGEQPVSTTKLGNPQVDDDFLDLMATKYVWVQWLRDLNKLNKLHGTYIDRVLNEQEDGIFYPSFFQHRTISGRYGSDLQQLPRPVNDDTIVSKYTNLIRTFFISGSGFKFIDNDYESLEPHVFAHVSGDEGLRDIFRNGHDFYSTIAIRTEGLNDVSADKSADNYLGKVNKDLRQNAKAYSLGIPYGMSAFALSKTLDISQNDAQDLWNDYLDGFPELKSWMHRSEELLRTEGIIVSEAGRVRHLRTAQKILKTSTMRILDPLYLYDKYKHDKAMYEQAKYLRKQVKNALNNAKNFQIQSLSASIVNRAAIAIARELKSRDIDGYVCAQIHDQLVVRVPDDKADECRDLVQDIMENNYKLSIKLKAPAEIGSSFADAH
jgi:DNA polymerase I-like protein with 3'-5' exonuclease and polymerase domains